MHIDLSIICPAFNEEAIIDESLTKIFRYLKDNISPNYTWEVLIVNDGSQDCTGKLAEKFASEHENFVVINHIVNMNLGNALKTGFANAKGEYTIVLDLDLSYDTYHIGNLFNTLIDTKADIVIASPYMKGGKVTAVPFVRKILSKSVNRFLRIAAQEKLYTYTGMVRGYKTEFLHSLNLKTKDYEINPEILYKAMILRARIIEIPAHLDWTKQNELGVKRTSGMRILKTFFSELMAGFIFRPYIFFLGLGLVLLIISMYIIGWIFINTIQAYPLVQSNPQFTDKFSMAVLYVFKQRPYSFYVGGIVLLAAIQILNLGFLSLQNKRYFDETFHLGTSILKHIKSTKNSL